MNFPSIARGVADKGFTVVYNNQGGELIPGSVCEFDLTATTAEQGYYVELVDVAVGVTTGIQAPVAGVVASTIATAAVGRLQVYGPATVRVNTTINAGKLAVATSAGVAPTGVAIMGVATTANSPEYQAASLGVCIDAVSATQSVVMLKLI